MPLEKSIVPSVMFAIAGALFLVSAFFPRDEPFNRFLAIIGVVLFLLAFGTYRRRPGPPSSPQ